MDLFASSVLRSLWAPALATVLAVGGCVSEKGRALDAGAPLPLHDSGASATLPEVLDDAGQADAALEADGGDASAGQGDPDGSAGEPDASAGSDAQVDGGGPACEPGFVLDGDDCVRDLCQASDDEPAACGEHGSCSDGTDEAPTCACDEGYVLESLQCVRNPCIPLGGDPVPCDANATCTYEGAGDASCECELGYDGDGETCERNACVMLPGEDPPCAAHEDCSPTGPGAKSCACAEGFDDCDASQGNGCEAELAVDEDHCGACGLACADGLECVAGECERRVTDMALGFYASIGVVSDGTVVGAGSGGAILRDHVASSVPVVLSLYDASQVSMNSSHACLVRANGMGAACWGSNANYQLGSLATDDTYEDLALSDVQAISAGSAHTCLVADNGRVYCWGRGDLGQLGNGMAQVGGSRTFADTFAGAGVPVLSVTDATDVHAGGTLSCALNQARNVYCWGAVSGTPYPPELVSNASGTTALSGALEICGGYAHACALLEDKSVVCWGSDSAGQLGSTTDPGGRNRWVPVALTDVSAIACGAYHACALLENGQVSCWGQNGSGELASGDAMPSAVPVPVLLPVGKKARAVYAGSGAVGTCFELTTGQVYCSGYNYYGQLGNGTSGVQQTTMATEITSWPL